MSFGSNSPYNSSEENREETGKKFGACGSTAGAELPNCHAWRGRMIQTLTKRTMKTWCAVGEEVGISRGHRIEFVFIVSARDFPDNRFSLAPGSRSIWDRVV